MAIPRVGDSIAPRFERCATITIYEIRDRRVVDSTDFSLQSQEALHRIRLLRDQGVDTVICGGVERATENILIASGIDAITWVTGSVDELLSLFVRGRLVGRSSDQPPPHAI
ncbi:MAG: NifB/NifX family molybdenum-iron cluster-binding protein [Deltaproteobacteria bacterium]|nr:NifB/NifX family molybdenum-iron cluster-binding protein [Deltaproteobacteria bacterium]MBW2532816.1 NifB/NifX family molybdenum-iron cluster-binding protein [Deltaproteobacteria bacterium]